MYLKSYTELKMALGGDVELTLVTDLPKPEVGLLFAKLWLQIFSFEKSFSRFISESELSRFNRRAGEHVRVSSEYKELLSAAKSMALKTNGLFNPFILPMLQRTGYRKSFVKQYEHDYQEDYSHYRVANPSELTIGADFAQIPENTALDMGGCGKGFLADKLAETDELKSLQGYWFSLGGDIVGKGTDEYGNPWSISVEDAVHPEEMLNLEFPMSTKKFSIATSGVIHRKGVDGNRRWHHLIDPTTGTAASTDVFLATVSAPTTLEADILASCAVIKGSKQALSYVKNHGANAALLQSKGIGRSVTYDYFGKVVEHREVVHI